MVKKGCALYTTLYQEVFYGNPGWGGTFSIALPTHFYPIDGRYSEFNRGNNISKKLCSLCEKIQLVILLSAQTFLSMPLQQ